ncbi:glycerate kinase [Actinomyces lilanjuaniae]|uniref:Glycerate kinase n=2 Tax=Actinomyces lilanjuaniae TaxID=2321394 RepID=A0ABM6Z5H9_9ACTO|nr:glycerate kinase [Actinomyces lilanjuaniae]
MVTYVLAPDSFKESMTTLQAAEAMAEGVRQADPQATCLLRPMADGGEGFARTLSAALGARRVEVPVHDALGAPVQGFVYLAGTTALLDVATAVGLEQIPPCHRDVMGSSSLGVGELVLAALDRGAQEVIIGLGGSATNDAGAGMLAALGVRFLDEQSAALAPVPAELVKVAAVDTSGLDPRLADVRVQAACDVTSPLLGPQGASAVFGPQKGATDSQVLVLDSLLSRLASLATTPEGVSGTEVAQRPGAGAAGGLGWALMTFLSAQTRPGVDLVMEASGLAEAVEGAAAVLTGEGSVDSQTLSGKTAAGVIRVAAAAGVPVAVFAGRVQADAATLLGQGVHDLVQITPEGTAIERALAEGSQNLRSAVARWVAAQEAS